VQRGVEIAEAVDAELLENAQLQKNICESAGAGDGVDHPEIQAEDQRPGAMPEGRHLSPPDEHTDAG